MSPSSSIPSQGVDSMSKTSQSRRNSTALAMPYPDTTQGKQASSTTDVHYTCFIRLPFPRPENFADPPPVEWDSVKDNAFWKLVWKASNSRDLDWEAIAAKFEVDLPFLMQQAAWLYERHFDSMKKQMQKLGVSAATSAAPSPVPPDSASASATAAGGAAGMGMQRVLSKDARIPSIITAKKDLATASGDSGSTPGTPRSLHAPISRTPSTTTVTQSRMLASGKQSAQRGFRTSSGSQRRPQPPLKPAESTQDEDESALGHDALSETDSEEEPSAMARSQAFRRAPLSKKPPMRTLSSDGDAEDDDEDEDSGGYLPFATATKPAREDPTATLKDSPRRPTATTQPSAVGKGRANVDPQPSSSASSASSAQQPPASSESNASSSQQRPGPISPRHRAQLANLSPRYSRKDGSEGSPSMGSSFSDLDDASVTRSAMEDALLSMQPGSAAGSMVSRMSSFGQALGRRQ